MRIGVPREIKDGENRAGTTVVSGTARIFAAGTFRTAVSLAEALV
jgi:alanine dehydrogenase